MRQTQTAKAAVADFLEIFDTEDDAKAAVDVPETIADALKHVQKQHGAFGGFFAVSGTLMDGSTIKNRALLLCRFAIVRRPNTQDDIPVVCFRAQKDAELQVMLHGCSAECLAASCGFAFAKETEYFIEYSSNASTPVDDNSKLQELRLTYTEEESRNILYRAKGCRYSLHRLQIRKVTEVATVSVSEQPKKVAAIPDCGYIQTSTGNSATLGHIMAKYGLSYKAIACHNDWIATTEACFNATQRDLPLKSSSFLYLNAEGREARLDHMRQKQRFLVDMEQGYAVQRHDTTIGIVVDLYRLTLDAFLKLNRDQQGHWTASRKRFVRAQSSPSVVFLSDAGKTSYQRALEDGDERVNIQTIAFFPKTKEFKLCCDGDTLHVLSLAAMRRVLEPKANTACDFTIDPAWVEAAKSSPGVAVTQPEVLVHTVKKNHDDSLTVYLAPEGKTKSEVVKLGRSLTLAQCTKLEFEDLKHAKQHLHISTVDEQKITKAKVGSSITKIHGAFDPTSHRAVVGAALCLRVRVPPHGDKPPCDMVSSTHSCGLNSLLMCGVEVVDFAAVVHNFEFINHLCSVYENHMCDKQPMTSAASDTDDEDAQLLLRNANIRELDALFKTGDPYLKQQLLSLYITHVTVQKVLVEWRSDGEKKAVEGEKCNNPQPDKRTPDMQELFDMSTKGSYYVLNVVDSIVHQDNHIIAYLHLENSVTPVVSDEQLQQQNSNRSIDRVFFDPSRQAFYEATVANFGNLCFEKIEEAREVVFHYVAEGTTRKQKEIPDPVFPRQGKWLPNVPDGVDASNVMVVPAFFRFGGEVKQLIVGGTGSGELPKADGHPTVTSVDSEEENTELDPLPAEHKLFLESNEPLSVDGDGNCLFRALAIMLGRNTSAHAKVREQIVEYLSKHWTRVPELDISATKYFTGEHGLTGKEYLRRMKNARVYECM